MRSADELRAEMISAVGSTGSPLAPEGFDYVYEHIKRDVNLASMSGGTDLMVQMKEHKVPLTLTLVKGGCDFLHEGQAHALRRWQALQGRSQGQAHEGRWVARCQLHECGKLGLIVVDEEHRFGVEHKEKLKALKTNTHVMTLTATPIPRTLMLTVFGDLDLSLLDQMPLGRKPIITEVLSPQTREKGYERVRAELALGRRVAVARSPSSTRAARSAGSASTWMICSRT